MRIHITTKLIRISQTTLRCRLFTHTGKKKQRLTCSPWWAHKKYPIELPLQKYAYTYKKSNLYSYFRTLRFGAGFSSRAPSICTLVPVGDSFYSKRSSIVTLFFTRHGSPSRPRSQFSHRLLHCIRFFFLAHSSPSEMDRTRKRKYTIRFLNYKFKQPHFRILRSISRTRFSTVVEPAYVIEN